MKQAKNLPIRVLKKAIKIVVGDHTDKDADIKRNWLLRDAEQLLTPTKYEAFYAQLKKGVNTAYNQKMTDEECDFLFFYAECGTMLKASEKMMENYSSWKKSQNVNRKSQKCLEDIVNKVKRQCSFDYERYFGITEKVFCLSKSIFPKKWEDVKGDSMWQHSKSSISTTTEEGVKYFLDKLLSVRQRQILLNVLKSKGIENDFTRGYDSELSAFMPMLHLYEDVLTYGSSEAMKRRTKQIETFEKRQGRKDMAIANMMYLSVRNCGLLINMGFLTAFDVFAFGFERLLEVHGFGPHAVDTLKESLLEEGYKI